MSIFSSPIGRLMFLVRVFPAFLLMYGGVLFILAKQSVNVDIIFLFLAVLVTIYVIGFAICPRLVSIGMSRWFSLLYFVPILGLPLILFLLFCPAGQFTRHDKGA
jgi:hypothetical protein